MCGKINKIEWEGERGRGGGGRQGEGGKGSPHFKKKMVHPRHAVRCATYFFSKTNGFLVSRHTYHFVKTA